MAAGQLQMVKMWLMILITLIVIGMMLNYDHAKNGQDVVDDGDNDDDYIDYHMMRLKYDHVYHLVYCFT